MLIYDRLASTGGHSLWTKGLSNYNMTVDELVLTDDVSYCPERTVSFIVRK